MRVTSSAKRWRILSEIILDVERAFEATCRLEQREMQERNALSRLNVEKAFEAACQREQRDIEESLPMRGRQFIGHEQLERRLDALTHDIDVYIDRVTAERLLSDLREKKARQAA